jgi:hypothetical protein
MKIDGAVALVTGANHGRSKIMRVVGLGPLV